CCPTIRELLQNIEITELAIIPKCFFIQSLYCFGPITSCEVVLLQLLELDPEEVISRGQATLSHKQKLIDECLEKSYEIALGCGRFGNCLVNTCRFSFSLDYFVCSLIFYSCFVNILLCEGESSLHSSINSVILLV
ncbi:Os02g0684600, partial [Oryza sativa Japonica Group]